MTSSQRYVFDTNTLISAVLFEEGNPGKAFRHALKSGTVLLSQATFEELDEVLAREKFEAYLKEGEREAFEELLHREARFVEVTETVEASRDPDDDKFLELTLTGEAEVIVSGDQDLLVLGPF